MLQYNFRVKFGSIQDSVQKSNEAFLEFYEYIGGYVLQSGIICQELVDIYISTTDGLSNNFHSLVDAVRNIQHDEDSPCSFLIHLEDVPKSTTAFSVINSVYDTLKGSPYNKIMFFLDDYQDLISETSIAEKLAEKLILIDFDGNYIAGEIDDDLNPGKTMLTFEHKFSLTQITTRENFQQKLIKHIGHFQKFSEDELLSCHKYFFDGNKCILEIGELLYDKIKSEQSFTKSFSLYSHAPFLDWGKKAFSIVDDKFYSNHRDTYNGWIRDFEDSVTNKPQLLVLLFDVINSGQTLGQIYQQAQRKFPSAKIVVYCIVDCHSTKANPGTNTTAIDIGEMVQVGHLLKEKQETFTKVEGRCPMCSPMNIAPTKFYKIRDCGHLSAFEMWTMIMDLDPSLAKEVVGEEGRFKNLLPNTLEIIRKNPGLLAYKFFCALKENNIKIANSTYLIYPDETASTIERYRGLKSNAVPSSLFISSLKLMYQYNIFGIPRSVIDEVKTNPEVLDSFQQDHPDLYSALRRLQTNNVIIVDEFPRTYTTYEAMTKILDKVGIKVVLYFTLFNFTPNLAAEKIKHTKHINLYEFEIE